MDSDTVTLTERDLHCIARLLQSALYGGDNNSVLVGCNFCRYKCFDEKEHKEIAPNYRAILRKFTAKTGVDLSPSSDGVLIGDFPYKKFLQNSNEEIKERCRNFFNDI